MAKIDEATATNENLEAQVAQLQNDLKTITQTLAKMGENKVDEVKSNAQHQARTLADRGQAALDSAQDEFEVIEKQVKDTIREKPLTAVATAVAAGFLLAVITR